MSAKPRILLYSHDTYGLGHLRRSLTIANQLAVDVKKSHQLLITGSMSPAPLPCRRGSTW